MAKEVRHPRQNGSRRTSGTFRVRLRLRGKPEIVKQPVAALIQQMMEMSEQLRQSEKASEQPRQLLEAHKSADQI